MLHKKRPCTVRIAKLLQSKKHNGADRAKQDILRQSSPDKTKKQQDADRAMAELLEDQGKAAGAKKNKKGKERSRQVAEGQVGRKETERAIAKPESETASPDKTIRQHVQEDADLAVWGEAIDSSCRSFHVSCK